MIGQLPLRRLSKDVKSVLRKPGLAGRLKGTDDRAVLVAARPKGVALIASFDELRPTICRVCMVNTEAVRLALGIRADGCKEARSHRIEQINVATVWLRFLDGCKNCCPDDVQIDRRLHHDEIRFR